MNIAKAIVLPSCVLAIGCTRQEPQSATQDQAGGQRQIEQVQADVLEQTLIKTVVSHHMTIEDLKSPANPTFARGTHNEFVIVPTKTVLSVDGKRAESLNYQFGAKPTGSADWKYIEGSRVNRGNVFIRFPDFPKDVQFPETYRKLLD
jgi:hypothetical protein